MSAIKRNVGEDTNPIGAEIAGDDVGMDPILAELLAQLWCAAQGAPEKPWSLAKLSKQSGMQMSTLRRYLTELSAAGIVDVLVREDGTGIASLTGSGKELCALAFK